MKSKIELLFKHVCKLKRNPIDYFCYFYMATFR